MSARYSVPAGPSSLTLCATAVSLKYVNHLEPVIGLCVTIAKRSGEMRYTLRFSSVTHVVQSLLSK
jgi:hypothetical protein